MFWGGWKKGAGEGLDKVKRAFEKGVSLEEDVLMSSDEDVPAPSPSAAVRRAGASRELCEVKPMREESGSDEDAGEPEE